MSTTLLLIIIAILLIALWISSMALWWQHEQAIEAKRLERRDVIHTLNKAARLARRSWYNTLRYSKKGVLWGNKKATEAFIGVFPKSRQAFVTQDPLTGLEHGPSSYFLATLSKPKKKVRVARSKKVHLSEE